MIEINNLTKGKISKEFFKKVVQSVLNGEKKKQTEISVVIMGAERIKELNKKYRKKNKATDVLSFWYDNCGEILICPQEIKKNVKIFHSKFKTELVRALIHGVLHTLGENHEKLEKAAKKMKEKENYYLKKIFKNTL